MNTREKILTTIVIVCSIVTSASLIRCYNLTNDYNNTLKTTSEFMTILETEGSIVPKIYIGEKYLFGESFNFSNWSHYTKQTTYLERYSGNLKEVIAIMKFQVHLLGEDPELFEQCLYSIYDFQQSVNSSDRHCIPYVAWKGRYADCPIAIHTPGEPSKYDDTDVWAIMILNNGSFSIETTYYVDTGTLKELPFVLGTD